MAFVYENISYISLNDFLASLAEGEKQNFTSRLPFAHQVDSKTIAILESANVTSVANKAVEAIVSEQLGVMLSTGLTVDPVSFPSVYDMLEKCCKTLNISIPHTIITNEMNGINAMATGTDHFAFVALSNYNLHLLSEGENQFIIGHECGHIAMGHIVYHSLGQVIGSATSWIPIFGEAIAGTIMLPLNAWSRCSEITSDRAGLICCGDLHTAQRALIKIVGGFTNTTDIDVDEYIKQSKESLDVHYIGTYKEFFMSHPLIPKRIEALELFSRSEMYYRVTGKPKPERVVLFTDEQLDNRVNQVMKILK